MVCAARQAGVSIAVPYGSQELSLLDLTFDDIQGSGSDGNGVAVAYPTAKVIDESIPKNLGQLGEEFAVAWLQRQQWVATGSVRWLNCNHDLQADHDIECEPTAEPGRQHIEVKTQWRKRGAKMSPRQLARLLDAIDNYRL